MRWTHDSWGYQEPAVGKGEFPKSGALIWTTNSRAILRIPRHRTPIYRNSQVGTSKAAHVQNGVFPGFLRDPNGTSTPSNVGPLLVIWPLLKGYLGHFEGYLGSTDT